MNLRKHPRPEPDINLTPLIDVVFLLLIFFMVSTTFNRESELAVELPQATTPPEASTEPVINVTIDAQGRFYVDGRQLLNTQAGTLRQALRSAVVEIEGALPPIVLSADADTPHQAVVVVMDVARQLGLARLRFAARLEEER